MRPDVLTASERMRVVGLRSPVSILCVSERLAGASELGQGYKITWSVRITASSPFEPPLRAVAGWTMMSCDDIIHTDYSHSYSHSHSHSHSYS